MPITISEYLLQHNIDLESKYIAFPCPTLEIFNYVKEFFGIEDRTWEHRENTYFVKWGHWLVGNMAEGYYHDDIKMSIDLMKHISLFQEDDFTL